MFFTNNLNTTIWEGTLGMANEKKKKLTPTQQEYQKFAKKREPARPAFRNCIRAFVAGGVVCVIGQGIQEMFIHWGGFDKKTAGSPTVAVLIIIAVLLTGFGLYDKLAQWGGRHGRACYGFREFNGFSCH